MLKKFFYAASICGMVFLASCGNSNKDNENANGEEVVGVEVDEEQTPDGTVEVAQEEVVAPVQEAAQDANAAVQNAGDKVKDAANQTAEKANAAADKAKEAPAK